MKNKIILSVLFSVFTSTLSLAADRSELMEKAVTASNVLKEIASISDRGIPESLLAHAVCVATIPDVISGGVVFGARYGTGLVSCRVDASHWSRPSFVKIVGGSWGLQIGIESTDVVLVFVNSNAPERLSHNNFTIGGDASVAAGPVGREAQAGTDYKLGSEIYSYSRSRGLFAGLTFAGSSMSIERDSNAVIYGHAETARELFSTRSGGSTRSPDIYSRTLMMYAK